MCDGCASKIDLMPAGTAARMLAAVWRMQKGLVDVEVLRAKLVRMYKRAFMTGARAGIAEAILAVRDLPGEVDESEAAVVMAKLERRIGPENLGTTIVGRAATVVRDVFEIGAGEAIPRLRSGQAARYKLTLADHRAIDLVTNHDLVWIKGHWDGEGQKGPGLREQLREATTSVMREGYSRAKLAERLSEELGGVVDKDASYWSDLADHTVTKAREIGRVSGFVEAGVTETVVHAVMDARTSAMCRSMNGRVIEVTHLEAQRDAVLGAKNPEALKNAMTWPTKENGLASGYHGKTDDLPGSIGIPPYHYRCRTTLMAVVRTEKAPVMRGGTEIAGHDRRIIDIYEPREHGYRAEWVRNTAANKGLDYERTLLPGDVRKIAKHAEGFGISAPVGPDGKKIATPEAMKKLTALASRAVATAEQTGVRMFTTGRGEKVMQYTFLSAAQEAEVSTDEAGVIRNVNPCLREDLQKRIDGRSGEIIWLT